MLRYGTASYLSFRLKIFLFCIGGELLSSPGKIKTCLEATVGVASSTLTTSVIIENLAIRRRDPCAWYPNVIQYVNFML